MTAMGYVIRPVASAAELAEVYDVMGAQFDPARTRGGRGFGELARLFPERRALMLLAQADDQIVGGAGGLAMIGVGVTVALTGRHS